MDNETRAAFAALSETMTSLDGKVTALDGKGTALDGKVTALDGKVTALDEKVTAGFARADRYFELQHEQHLELRHHLDALVGRVARLEHEVALLRDFVTREIAEIRLELRELRARPGQSEELRREVAALTVRVDRLEQRQPD